MDTLAPDDPTTRLLLRHTLATLAYRAGKTLRGTTAEFGAYRVTPDSPSSLEIVEHMGDLMDWVLRTVEGEPKWTTAPRTTWDAAIAHFFGSLQVLDERLAAGAPMRCEPGRLYQGGIADALTHTGQLAMLRRLSGHKMKGESYYRADIAIGRVGLEQVPPKPEYEFD